MADDDVAVLPVETGDASGREPAGGDAPPGSLLDAAWRPIAHEVEQRTQAALHATVHADEA
ncbi:hypothetical protein [Geminicoccus flavidas]|uniref:hypothetical protein n=1 Tax=Geminicoccus flavidas TaxID=2506407 RepID=UPI0013593483|nr:hypothetical protein [Geminicoccus flavidas]